MRTIPNEISLEVRVDAIVKGIIHRPDTYEALAAPEPDEWERRQKFIIPNPPSSPWPK
jgi:hypothetical protein